MLYSFLPTLKDFEKQWTKWRVPRTEWSKNCQANNKTPQLPVDYWCLDVHRQGWQCWRQLHCSSGMAHLGRKPGEHEGKTKYSLQERSVTFGHIQRSWRIPLQKQWKCHIWTKLSYKMGCIRSTHWRTIVWIRQQAMRGSKQNGSYFIHAFVWFFLGFCYGFVPVVPQMGVWTGSQWSFVDTEQRRHNAGRGTSSHAVR